MKKIFEIEKPFQPTLLPPKNIETIQVMRQTAHSRSALAELKGIAHIIPNEEILIENLLLREAGQSSAIENIITTQDDLYRAKVDETFKTHAIKEVQNYTKSMRMGFEIVKNKQLLTNATLKKMQEILLQNKAGFRTQTGTTLKNQQGKIIYTPPQDKDTILNLMQNLERFINEKEFSDLDPLIKMAIIHYQFETVHPFYDGNGRIGRMINILYLVLQNLLDTPILYLSNYIITHKKEYYDVLQNVREKNDWEAMILFLLKAVERTAKETIKVTNQIKDLMQVYKNKIRKTYPKMYSQDLVNNLFKHPYTKIEFLAEDLQIVYDTSRRYLDKIVGMGLLRKEKRSRSNYYLNDGLIELLRWRV